MTFTKSTAGKAAIKGNKSRWQGLTKKELKAMKERMRLIRSKGKSKASDNFY